MGNAFKALLDVGIKRTILGSKIFSAMKGAFDGGLEIPHSEKKFYGYDADEGEYGAEANRARILGDHVCEYMNSLQGKRKRSTIRSSPSTLQREFLVTTLRHCTSMCTRRFVPTPNMSQLRRRSLLMLRP